MTGPFFPENRLGCARLLLAARANVRAMTTARTSAAHLAAARAVAWKPMETDGPMGSVEIFRDQQPSAMMSHKNP